MIESKAFLSRDAPPAARPACCSRLAAILKPHRPSRSGICTGLAVPGPPPTSAGNAPASPRFFRHPQEKAMPTEIADQIRNEIAAVRGEIEEQKALAKRNVQNVAVESEIAQRLRALHVRLDELERNLEQLPVRPN